MSRAFGDAAGVKLEPSTSKILSQFVTTEWPNARNILPPAMLTMRTYVPHGLKEFKLSKSMPRSFGRDLRRFFFNFSSKQRASSSSRSSFQHHLIYGYFFIIILTRTRGGSTCNSLVFKDRIDHRSYTT